MTCIVGLEHEGKVYMGADSASSNGLSIHETRIDKVFRNGEYLIGYTTSFRMGQIIQYNLHIEPATLTVIGHDGMAHMVTKFIPALRKALAEGGFTKIENNEETGGLFLVGYHSQLYIIDSDFQVNSHANGYAAVGCGGKYAEGSMYATKDSQLSPVMRIEAALNAANHFSNGVCEPFHIKVL